MSKRSLESRLFSLDKNISTSSDEVETLDAVPESEVEASRAVTAREVVSVSPDTLTIDLLGLKGHRIDDAFSVASSGSVFINGSLRRVKPKADDIQKRMGERNRLIIEAQANASLAESEGNIPKAKEYLALAQSLIDGQTTVVKDSGKTAYKVNLNKGQIEGERFVFVKQSPTSLWFDGQEYRLRLTVSRKLLEGETPRPTEKQTARATRKADRLLLAQQALAGAKAIGRLEQRIQLREESK